MFFKSGDTRKAVMIFVAGASLGWGISRHCWEYYSREVPPLKAAMAHGAASYFFTRTVLRIEKHWPGLVQGVAMVLGSKRVLAGWVEGIQTVDNVTAR